MRRTATIVALVVLLVGLVSPVRAGPGGERVPARPPVIANAPLASAPSTVTYDPMVQWMIDLVQTDTLALYDGSLSGAFPIDVGGQPYTITTRYTYSGDPIYRATQWAGQHMEALGLDVEYQNWASPNYPNVIGTLWGETNPTETVIICAHLDSTTLDDPMQSAPGADDNGSGATAVLMAADILSQYHWGCTLRFALWTGEEQGLLGSEAYAQRAEQNGEQIKAVLNLDMIGWNTLNSPPNIDVVASATLTPTVDLAQTFIDVVGAYNLNLLPEIRIASGGSSDHASFWQHGYTAILGMEGNSDYSPYFHSEEDTLEHLNMGFFVQMVKAAVATTAHMSGCLIPTGFGTLQGHVTDAGSGAPIAGVEVSAYGQDHIRQTLTDPAGAYSHTLQAGSYTVTAVLYDYLPVTMTGVVIPSDTVTTLDIAMSIAPTFTVSGYVLEEGSGAPLAAQVAFVGTPVAVATDPATGAYQATVAEGLYIMRVSSWQHRPVERVVLIDQDQVQDFLLEGLPCILLVDGDMDAPDVRAYYTSTLDSMDYAYDLWDVSTAGSPPAEALLGYPAVFWYTGYPYLTDTLTTENEVVLRSYLQRGGNLFLSSQGYLWQTGLSPFGQDYLGVNSFSTWSWNGQLVAGTAGDPVGNGLGPYTLTRPPDWPAIKAANISAAQANPFTWPALHQGNSTRYQSDSFKTVFLSWPLEALGDLADRQEVLGRVLDWFDGCLCNPPYGLDFGWTPPLPSAQEPLTLTAIATTTVPTAFTWDLGDGTLVSGEQVAHTYSAAGAYTVVLTATSCTSVTAAVTHTVTVLPACEPVSGAAFAWAPPLPTAGEAVTLTATASGTAPISFTWNLGDGSPLLMGAAITHTYATGGDYVVSLLAANGCGQETVTHTLPVTEQVVPCVPAQQLAFSWIPLTPTVGQPITATASVTGTPPITLSWSFGDGGTGSGASVTHTFTAAGSYTITVTAANGCGWAIEAQTVVVQANTSRWVVYLPIVYK